MKKPSAKDNTNTGTQDISSHSAMIFGRMVGAAVRWRWPVLLFMLAATIGAGVYTARTIGVTTDTTEMLSPDLPFRKAFSKYRAAFPRSKGTMVVVVDGKSEDAARTAADKLVGAMRKDPTFGSIFYPAGSKFFRQNGFLYLSTERLEKLSDRLSEAQPFLGTLSGDPSLRGLSGLLVSAIDALGTKEGKPEALARPLKRIIAVMEGYANGHRRKLDWAALLSGDVSPADGKRQIIVTQPRIGSGSLSGRQRFLKKTRALVAARGLANQSNVLVRLTGSFAIGAEELSSVSTGASRAGLISLVLVTILLVWGLRSIWSVASVLVTLIIGLVLTAGFAALAIGSLNLISVAFAVLFIGLGVDFGIHYALRWSETVSGLSEGGERRLISHRFAGAAVGGALTVTAVAAALAFLSFLPTEYRGVAELGLIAGVGMGIALLTSLTVLPVLLSFGPLPKTRSGSVSHAAVRLEGALHRRSGSVLIVAALLAVAAAALAPFAQFDRNPLNLKDFSTESVRTALDLIRDPNIGSTPIQVLTPGLKQANVVAARLRKLTPVRSVRTLTSFVPKDQADKLEIIEDLRLTLLPLLQKSRKPSPTAEERRLSLSNLRSSAVKALSEKDGSDNRAGSLKSELVRLEKVIGRLLSKRGDNFVELDADLLGALPPQLSALRLALGAQTVTLATLPNDIRQRYLAADGTARIEVIAKSDLRDKGKLREFVEAIAAVTPAATGSPVVELRAGDAVVGAFVQATITAFILIALMLFLILRRVADVLLVMLPLILAGLLTFAVSVLGGIDFNFANVIVLPLLLGLGAAGSIHLVVRARQDFNEGEMPLEGQHVLRQQGQVLTTSTPRAILFSALTTVASFGSLAVSGHRGTASMGVLLFIAITLTLVCTLIVLPAALSWLSQRRMQTGKI